MNIQNVQKGFSLVEILVALTIGLFLIGGISSTYAANKQVFRFTEALAEVQENGRFAIDMIAQDLRAADFRGCSIIGASDPAALVNNLDSTSDDFDANIHEFFGRDAIEGIEAGGLNSSDSIVVRGVNRRVATIQEPFNLPTWHPINVADAKGIEVGDLVLVSNCQAADIFQVSSKTLDSGTSFIALGHTTAGAPGNASSGTCGGSGNSHCLSRTYGADAIVTKLQHVRYSVATGTSGRPALWRSINGVNEELIGGIGNLQILYGIDTDNDGSVNQYVDSDAVVSMESVLALRLTLLVESTNDRVIDAPQVYEFNGTTTTAADRRLRQVFSATIGLRNRLGS